MSYSERMQLKKKNMKLYLYYESYYKEARMSFVLISEVSTEKTVAITIEIIYFITEQESTCEWTLERPASETKEDKTVNQPMQTEVFIPFEDEKPFATVRKEGSREGKITQARKVQKKRVNDVGKDIKKIIRDSYFIKLKNDAIRIFEYYLHNCWCKEQKALLNKKLNSIFFYLEMTNNKLPLSSILSVYSMYFFLNSSTYDTSTIVLRHTLKHFYLFLILSDPEITKLPSHIKFQIALIPLEAYILHNIDEYSQALKKYILREVKWNGN